MRYAWTLGFLFIVSTGCSQLNPPDARQQANDRWSAVRARLKYELATEQFEVGHLDEAFNHVREAIGLNPSAGDAYILLARIQLERGETAMAVETVNEALTSGTDNAETDYLNGVIAERYQRFADALKWYRSASKRDPLNAHYVVATAETLVHLDRPAEALQLVEQRWTDFEQNATLRSLAGAIHMMLGRYEEAAGAYQQARSIAPDDATLGFELGRALTLARRYEEGLDVLTAAVDSAELTPASIRLLIGQCQMALQRYGEAKGTFQMIVDAEPQNAEGWSALAQASVAADELISARRAAARAAQIEPEHLENVLLVGFVCYRQKDFTEAVSCLERVVECRPSESVALCLLGRSHQELGNEALARQYYRQALEVDAECRWARQLLTRGDAPGTRKDSP